VPISGKSEIGAADRPKVRSYHPPRTKSCGRPAADPGGTAERSTLFYGPRDLPLSHCPSP